MNPIPNTITLITEEINEKDSCNLPAVVEEDSQDTQADPSIPFRDTSMFNWVASIDRNLMDLGLTIIMKEPDPIADAFLASTRKTLFPTGMKLISGH